MADPLDTLLQQWQQSCRAGQPLSAETLCQQQPELIAQLKSRIASVSTVDAERTTDFVGRQPLVSWPEYFGRYRIDEEIARGGMGAVLRAHDAAFGRTLAIKVLLDKWNEPRLRQRFLEEAQLTGRLQHPGIPPVHEHGCLPDGRPFFAMKLIEGSTLLTLLQQRPSTTAELPRFISIFEQVCQTIAYAHSRGVIHRDLKPGNVMVGAFGEVQVMDWGLAKIPRSPAAPVADAMPQTSMDAASDEQLTYPGAVLGTLAYMAPEQARGATDLDERCDVFGLGAILCVILTGQSPYRARADESLLEAAVGGDLADAWIRLDRCGGDAELIALAKACLAPGRDERPRHAGAVAAAIIGYLEKVRERVRQAELERKTAELKAAEERKRARLKLVLAVAAVLLVAGASGVFFWREYERAAQELATLQRAAAAQQRHTAREERIAEALQDADRLRDELHAQLIKRGAVFQLLDRPAEWQRRLQEARAALQRAVDIGASAETSIAKALRERISRLTVQLQDDDRDRRTALQVDEIRTAIAKSVKPLDYDAAEEQYAAIFADYGFVLAESTPQEHVGSRIRKSPIWEQLLAGLDDWARIAGIMKKKELRLHLLTIAVRAEPDPIRTLMCDPEFWNDPSSLQRLTDGLLANKETLAQVSPAMKLFLAAIMANNRLDARPWLQAAQYAHPQDFWLNFLYGWHLRYSKKADQAIGYCRVAVALRPHSTLAWYTLGGALYDHKQFAESILAFEEALKQSPQLVEGWIALGVAQQALRQFEQAASAFAKAVDIEPARSIAWVGYGNALYQQESKLEEAAAAYEKALSIHPNLVEAWIGVGIILYDQGQYVQAAEYCQQALERSPRNVTAWFNLGRAFYKQHRSADAAVAFRKSVALEPTNAHAWEALGRVLIEEDFRGAAAAFNMAVKHSAPQDRLHSTAQRQLKTVEQLLDSERRLTAELAGRNLTDELVRAEVLRQAQRFRSAVRWYGAAFAKRPPSVSLHRYNAACAAVLAAAGVGKDAANMDAAERARLRLQAVDWLHADLQNWQQLVERCIERFRQSR